MLERIVISYVSYLQTPTGYDEQENSKTGNGKECTIISKQTPNDTSLVIDSQGECWLMLRVCVSCSLLLNEIETYLNSQK